MVHLGLLEEPERAQKRDLAARRRDGMRDATPSPVVDTRDRNGPWGEIVISNQVLSPCVVRTDRFRIGNESTV